MEMPHSAPPSLFHRIRSPSKGKSYTGLGKKCRLMKTVQTMKGRGNYRDCPVMRPFASSYGTYVTLAPKVLVFPVCPGELMATTPGLLWGR